MTGFWTVVALGLVVWLLDLVSRPVAVGFVVLLFIVGTWHLFARAIRREERRRARR